MAISFSALHQGITTPLLIPGPRAPPCSSTRDLERRSERQTQQLQRALPLASLATAADGRVKAHRVRRGGCMRHPGAELEGIL